MRTSAASLILCLTAAAGCSDREAERNMSPDEVAEELSHMRMAPGLWEVNSEVIEARGPDLPREVRNRMVGPRPSRRHCLTAEQAAPPSAEILAARSGRDCVQQDFRVADGRLSGTMICPNARVRMAGRYGPQAYETRMEMETPVADVVMTLELRIRGRRIGDCPGGG